MRGAILIAVSGTLVALSALSLPSFDWQAALFVGAIVALGTAVVLTVALATSVIAIPAGATLLGTVVWVAVISLITGIIGGTAAGFYWGRQGDIKRQEQIDRIKRVSNQLDIRFEPRADDPKRAADFQCTLVFYEETDLASRQPTFTTRSVKINATESGEFYSQLEQQLKLWFDKQVAGDADGQSRKVVIYMDPYPGEGIYERIKEMAEQNEVRKCDVRKVEGKWKDALP